MHTSWASRDPHNLRGAFELAIVAVEPVAPAAPETTTVPPLDPPYIDQAEVGGHAGDAEHA